MSEALLWAVTKSILGHIASFAGDVTCSYATQGILATQSVRNDLKKIENKLIAIRAVLDDAERKQYDSEAIRIWLKDLKSVVYDIDDLLDEVGTDLLRRRVNKGHVLQQMRYYLSSSNPILSHFHWSQKIRDLLQSFDDIASNRRDLGLDDHPVETHNIERNPLDAFSYVKKTEIIGRDEAKCEIVRRLTSSCVGEASRLVVLPIVGLGGIGKTALAKLVFNDEWVSSNFDVKLWACVSENFDLQKTIEEILNSVSKENTANLSLRQLYERLSEILDGRKHFLVLDDVWIEDIKAWRDLENLVAISEKGSVILVTTRSKMVASVVGNVEPYCLNNLSSDVCWSIFKQLAFKSGEEERFPNLARIGRNIVDKCGGVPLVVKVLASLLRSERVEREWMRIAETNNIVNLHPQHNDIKQALKVSYNKLPSHLKACFAYCSLFVKDTKLNPPILSCFWSALGLLQRGNSSEELESVGYKCCEDLLSRSLLQDAFIVFTETTSQCKMHDLFHDLATDIVGQEIAVVTSSQLNVSEICRHLVWGYEGGEGLSDKGFPKELLRAKKARTFRFGGYAMGCISRSFIKGIIHNFRCLRVLDFHQSSFEELPRSIGNLKQLRYLDLSYNPIIKVLPSTICKLLNLQSLFLPGCEMLQELPKDIDQLISLRFFSVTTNQVSLGSTKFNGLSSLGRLELYSCEELTSLWDDFSVQFHTTLLELHIVNCPRLTCLPDSMKHLVALETLIIRDCQELDLEKGSNLWGLQSLRTLEITGVTKLKHLPDGIQSAANSLQYLWIDGCEGLAMLPSWLQNFTSLRRILIYSCLNLVALPEGFGQLNCLQKLLIKNCPHLSKRCSRYTGEDYPHISHVPEVYLDESRINGIDVL